MFSKLFAPAVFAIGAYKGADKIKALSEYPQVAATQIELAEMASFMQTDSAAGQKFTDNSAEFSRYLRANFKNSSRNDTSVDFWGQPYRIVVNGDTVYIASNGPDRAAETTDDIKINVELQK